MAEIDQDIHPDEAEAQLPEAGYQLVRNREISDLVDGAEKLPPGKHNFKLTNGTIFVIDHDNAAHQEDGVFKATGTKPEIHEGESDEITCRRGIMLVRVGGELVNPTPATNKDGSVRPNELIGDGIRGGREVRLYEGDMMRIPPDVAHLHTSSPETPIAAATFTKAAKEPRF